MLRRCANLKKALLLVEHNGGVITPATRSAATAAAKLGPITALVAGKGSGSIAEAAGKITGVEKVLSADSEEYANLMPESYTTLVNSVKDGFSHVVAPHSAFGRGVIPRAAAIADAAPLTDITEIVDGSTYVRPTYAGNAMVKVKVEQPTTYLTIRGTAFDKAADGGSGTVEATAPQGAFAKSRFVSETSSQGDKPQLDTARVVISGGRGLAKSENFKLLDDFAANVPDCAVGATRAVVDLDWCPNDMQVGQTGKVVAPELYIAVGLSGAIQHLTGMKDSKMIVCINKDEDAPIFSVADFGLKGDLFEAMPPLIDMSK